MGPWVAGPLPVHAVSPKAQTCHREAAGIPGNFHTRTPGDLKSPFSSCSFCSTTPMPSLLHTCLLLPLQRALKQSPSPGLA